MTTTNGGPNGGQAQAAPQLNVLAQYIKDFSFENPNAPRSLQQQQAQPQINIQINVNAKPLAESDYEVELKIEGRAEVASLFLFGFDLLYAGVFRIQGQSNLEFPIDRSRCGHSLFQTAQSIKREVSTPRT